MGVIRLIMEFGSTEKCSICKKYPEGRYHKYTSDILGMDLVFYACEGDCNKKFRSEYVEPFKPIPIKNRWELLDL